MVSENEISREAKIIGECFTQEMGPALELKDKQLILRYEERTLLDGVKKKIIKHKDRKLTKHTSQSTHHRQQQLWKSSCDQSNCLKSFNVYTSRSTQSPSGFLL